MGTNLFALFNRDGLWSKASLSFGTKNWKKSFIAITVRYNFHVIQYFNTLIQWFPNFFSARSTSKISLVREAQKINLYYSLGTTWVNLADHYWSAEQTLGITALIDCLLMIIQQGKKHAAHQPLSQASKFTNSTLEYDVNYWTLSIKNVFEMEFKQNQFSLGSAHKWRHGL